MSYYPHIDLLLLAAAGLTLILIAMIGTRRQQEPPRWMEQANGPLKPRYAKSIRGYDPVVKTPIMYDVKCVDLGRL